MRKERHSLHSPTLAVAKHAVLHDFSFATGSAEITARREGGRKSHFLTPLLANKHRSCKEPRCHAEGSIGLSWVQMMLNL